MNTAGCLDMRKCSTRLPAPCSLAACSSAALHLGRHLFPTNKQTKLHVGARVQTFRKCLASASNTVCAWPHTDEDDLQLPFHGDADGLAAARLRALGSTQLPHEPLVVVAVAVQSCQVSVPYGIEPGMAIRSTELWVKAFSQVCPTRALVVESLMGRVYSCREANRL